MKRKEQNLSRYYNSTVNIKVVKLGKIITYCLNAVLNYIQIFNKINNRKHLEHILKIHRGEVTIQSEDEEMADDDNVGSDLYAIWFFN